MGSTSSLLDQNGLGYILFCCQYNSPNNCQIPSWSGTTSRKITNVGRREGKGQCNLKITEVVGGKAGNRTQV